MSGLVFKAGDALYGSLRLPQRRHALRCSAATAASTAVAVAACCPGRGDGQPITSLIDLEAGTQPARTTTPAPPS